MEYANVLDIFKLCIPLENNNDNLYDNNYGSKIVQDSIRKNNIWSKEETSLFIDIIKNNKEKYNNCENTVIDVGSNTGYFSMISLSYNCNVIAIEANPVYKKYIEKSIEINNFEKSNFKYYENFVSNIKEDILFDGWSGNLNMMVYQDKFYVKSISLDEICDTNVLILKIDVEGCESQVFNSAKNLIQNKKIKYIIFELTYMIKNEINFKELDILPYLKNNNFDLYEICDKLIPINNIRQRLKYWINQYNNNHVLKNPNIVNLYAGTNILAVYKGNYLPSINLFT